MKIRHSLIIGCLTALLGFGAFLGAGANREAKVEKAEATSTATKCFNTSDGSLYYLAYWNDDWAKYDAKIWGYFWDGSGHNCWTESCINIDDNKIYYDDGPNATYYVIVPSSRAYKWTNVRLHRFDPDSSSTRGTEWSKTKDIELNDTFNCVAPWGTTSACDSNKIDYSVNYFEAGQTYYLDLSNDNYDWLASGRNIYGHLFTGNVLSGTTDVLLTRVLGFSNIYLYQLVIPDTSDYFRLIFHRGTTSSGWDNETATLYVDTSKNVFKLTSYEGAGSWNWNLSDADRANYYGTYFLDQVKCSGKGSITTDNWSNASSEYGRISTTIQGIIWSSSGSDTGTDLQKAMYRYDYIVFYKQYASHNDFIGRDDSDGKTTVFGVANVQSFGEASYQEGTTMIAVMAASVSVVAAAGFVFLKKKKSI